MQKSFNFLFLLIDRSLCYLFPARLFGGSQVTLAVSQRTSN